MGFALLIASPLLAAAASLAGLVQDSSGAPISRAQITLNLQGASAAPIITVTDKTGKFAIMELAPAKYDIVVESLGFRKWRESGLEIGANGVQHPPITLEIGDGGCPGSYPPRSRFRRMLAEIKDFFVPVDWTKIQICQ